MPPATLASAVRDKIKISIESTVTAHVTADLSRLTHGFVVIIYSSGVTCTSQKMREDLDLQLTCVLLEMMPAFTRFLFRLTRLTRARIIP